MAATVKKAVKKAVVKKPRTRRKPPADPALLAGGARKGGT